MARDGKWSKDSKAGKYTVLKTIIENPGTNQNRVCPDNSRARENIRALIESGFIQSQWRGGQHALYVTESGLDEFAKRT